MDGEDETDLNLVLFGFLERAIKPAKPTVEALSIAGALLGEELARIKSYQKAQPDVYRRLIDLHIDAVVAFKKKVEETRDAYVQSVEDSAKALVDFNVALDANALRSKEARQAFAFLGSHDTDLTTRVFRYFSRTLEVAEQTHATLLAWKKAA